MVYEKIYIYKPFSKDLTEEKKVYDGKECKIIDNFASYEYIIQFDDGNKLLAHDMELK